MAFRFSIQRRGGFIQNQNGGVFQNGTSDGDALPLTTGQHNAIFANLGVVAFRQFTNKFIGMGSTGRLLNFRSGFTGQRTVGNVVADRTVKQRNLLTNDGNLLAQIRQGKITDIGIVQQYAAAGYFIKTR